MSERGEETRQSASAFSMYISYNAGCLHKPRLQMHTASNEEANCNCISFPLRSKNNYTFIQNWFGFKGGETEGKWSLAWLHIIWCNYAFTRGSVCSHRCNIVFSVGLKKRRGFVTSFWIETHIYSSVNATHYHTFNTLSVFCSCWQGRWNMLYF